MFLERLELSILLLTSASRKSEKNQKIIIFFMYIGEYLNPKNRVLTRNIVDMQKMW